MAFFIGSTCATIAMFVSLKTNENEIVILDGKQVDMSFDSIRLSPGSHEVILRVNSF